MGRIYDNWERQVGATLQRDELCDIACALSREPSLSSISSYFSCTFNSSLGTLKVHLFMLLHDK